jgi:WS/DGAT/MGAT family acyltransferase
MQQLSGTDTSFLTVERGNNYSHVGALALYDPATAPGGEVRFKDILAHFDVRMHCNPFFRRRLVETPLGIDRPYWIDTADFDVEFHVRHIALPEPGDWRQLMIQVARLHARPLDRGRPLWEIYVIGGLNHIPGLPPGCFALFYKMHHAAVDGMASLHVISQMHAENPDPVKRSEKPEAIITDREPGLMEMGSKAIFNQGRRTAALSRLAAGSAFKLAKSAGDIAFGERHIGDLINNLAPAPKTHFSGKVSPHRVAEGVGLPLDAFKALRGKVKGITINDIFLAVVSGAMRRYLLVHHELPDESLVTMMPVSLRANASAGGNAVGAARTSLHTDIEDPLERLQACHDSAMAQRGEGSILNNEMPVLTDNLPGALTGWLVHRMAPSMNTVVSNVRGPAQAQYLAGAELQRLYPISIPTDSIGINHTAVSYAGYMWVGVVACRDMLPDPDFYAQCIRDSFNELLQAADIKPVHSPAFDNGASSD